jgi:hypothetical protein
MVAHTLPGQANTYIGRRVARVCVPGDTSASQLRIQVRGWGVRGTLTAQRCPLLMQLVSVLPLLRCGIGCTADMQRAGLPSADGACRAAASGASSSRCRVLVRCTRRCPWAINSPASAQP